MIERPMKDASDRPSEATVTNTGRVVRGPHIGVAIRLTPDGTFWRVNGCRSTSRDRVRIEKFVGGDWRTVKALPPSVVSARFLDPEREARTP